MWQALLFLQLIQVLSLSKYPPEQVHLALGFTDSEIRVQWLTWDSPIVTETLVEWGTSKDNLNNQAKGDSFAFVDPGPSSDLTRAWHIATMTDLKPHVDYFYRVGSAAYGWSSVMTFRRPSVGKEEQQNYLIIGDLGTTNAQTVPALIRETESNDIDMLLHVGDMAYDMHEDNGTRSDQFFRMIEPIANRIPYMVSLGNHESAYNFSHYTHSFQNMPSNSGCVTTNNGDKFNQVSNNWFYSWDVGLVHFIAISTEIYFDYPELIQAQNDWVKADLQKANKNRDNIPWIVVHGHRSIYCSCDGDCDESARLIRAALEPLFIEYGVEFFINGHEHNYERLWDIRDSKTEQKTQDFRSTVYIVSGCAGNRENHEPFRRAQPSWSAFRSNTYGYSKMTVYNRTHIHWQQIETDDENPQSENVVIDDVMYVKRDHGPFPAEIKATWNFNGITRIRETHYEKNHTRIRKSPKQFSGGYDELLNARDRVLSNTCNAV